MAKDLKYFIAGEKLTAGDIIEVKDNKAYTLVKELSHDKDIYEIFTPSTTKVSKCVKFTTMKNGKVVVAYIDPDTSYGKLATVSFSEYNDRPSLNGIMNFTNVSIDGTYFHTWYDTLDVAEISDNVIMITFHGYFSILRYNETTGLFDTLQNRVQFSPGAGLANWVSSSYIYVVEPGKVLITFYDAVYNQDKDIKALVVSYDALNNTVSIGGVVTLVITQKKSTNPSSSLIRVVKHSLGYAIIFTLTSHRINGVSQSSPTLCQTVDITGNNMRLKGGLEPLYGTNGASGIALGEFKGEFEDDSILVGTATTTMTYLNKCKFSATCQLEIVYSTPYQTLNTHRREIYQLKKRSNEFLAPSIVDGVYTIAKLTFGETEATLDETNLTEYETLPRFLLDDERGFNFAIPYNTYSWKITPFRLRNTFRHGTLIGINKMTVVKGETTKAAIFAAIE